MTQNKKLNHELTQLNELKTPENWMEMTGPFYHIKASDNETFGPFHSHDISSLLENTTLPDETLIKDAKNTGKWAPLYSHPAFQRRKPSIVTEISNIQASAFYILKNGSPVGPIKPSEMELLIKNKDIISTDAVSIDEGKSWLKLYQVPGFDQRSYSASELPIIPDKSEDEDEPKNLMEDDESTQIANLVYIESKKSKEKDVVANESTDESPQASKKGLYIIIGLIIIGLALLLSKSNVTEVTKPNKKSRKVIKEAPKSKVENKRAPAKKKAQPVKARNRVNTPPPVREAKPKSRTPKSFTSTPIYKDRKKMKDNALEEEESYYDDGEGDIENDAVRKAVSKETLYPEDSEVLEPEELEEDIYKDEIDDLDSEENEISSAEDVWGDEVPAKKGAKGTRDPFEDDPY